MQEYLKYWKEDSQASIVVFLVALPLCLGIALASGAPLFSGLIAGIIGGLVIGTLSKSQLSVSGPAAGLVVIVLNAVESLGSYEAFLLAVSLAGVIQIVFGYIKAGIFGMYFPSSVIKGMLAAIGLILILKQVPHLIGFEKEAFGNLAFFRSDGSNTFSHLLSAISQLYWGGLIVGMSSLGLLLLWERPFIKQNAILKQVPSGVIAVIWGSALNFGFKAFAPGLYIEQSHRVNIPQISDIETLSMVFRTPDFSALLSLDVYITAATLAIVASLETLLSIEAVDKLDPLKRRIPQNAELKAQGVGNFLSGLIGGLPITAVIVRSSANVAAGGKTKLSAILHGLLLLTAVALFPNFMNHIPLAALAAILVSVGYKLTNPALYRRQFSLGQEQFVPFIATVLAIMFSDLLIGIIIGMNVGVFYILKVNYKTPYYFDQSQHEETGQHVITIQLSEHVSFLNKASLQLTLEHLPENSSVIIDGSKSEDIDYDALEVIRDFKENSHEKNISLTLKNIPKVIHYKSD